MVLGNKMIIVTRRQVMTDVPVSCSKMHAETRPWKIVAGNFLKQRSIIMGTKITPVTSEKKKKKMMQYLFFSLRIC